MSKLTTNFQLQEFVHPLIWLKLGERSYSAINPVLPLVCQQLRDEVGPITINDWLWNIRDSELDSRQAWSRCFTDSGLRLPMGLSNFSAHKFGFAADLKFDDADPQQLQHYIMQNESDFPSIIRMENAEVTDTWLHIEVGRREGPIVVFDP